MQKLQGWAEQGNTQLTISGAAGTIQRRVQGSYPGATVTVYINSPQPVAISTIQRFLNIVTVTVPANSGFIAGQQVTIVGVTDTSFNGTFVIASLIGTTQFTYAQTGAGSTSSGGTANSLLRKALIYADNSSTPKANPFTAATDATWFFYAPDGVYDVQFSGAGIAAPFTIGGLSAFDQNAMWIDVTAAPYFAGNGAVDDSSALQAAINAVPAQGGTLFFPGSRTYNLTSPITITRGFLKIMAEDGAILQYNGGATSYIIGDNGSATTLYFCVEIDGLTIRGNANVQYGLKITSLHHSYFTHLRIQNVVNTGMYVGFAVGNIYDVRVSNNDCPGGAFAVKPVCGIDLAGISDSAGATGSDCYFMVEGVSGSGIRMGFTDYNTLKGFSESNNIGLETYTPGVTRNMSVISMDFESNATADVVLNGCYYSQFIGINSNSLFHFVNGRGIAVIGGQFNNITIEVLGLDAMLTGWLIYIGTLIDNQPDRTIKIGVLRFDIPSSTFFEYSRFQGDDLDIYNRNNLPTTAFIRQSSAQGFSDLMQFTSNDRSTRLSSVAYDGAINVGESTKGQIHIQPSLNNTNMGYLEFFIGGTRYAYFGNGTAGTVALNLENGAKWALSNGGCFSRTVAYTSTFTFGIIANGSAVTTTFAVGAAALGDTCIPSLNVDLQGTTLNAYVSSPGIVTVTVRNNTGGTVNLGTPTVGIDLWQH